LPHGRAAANYPDGNCPAGSFGPLLYLLYRDFRPQPAHAG
jgi:hypothetical protein